MFRGGSRWSTIAWILAMMGFFVSIFVTGVSTATGNPQNVLWGLWISIFWLNITVFVLAIGANNQLTAIYWALRGTKDESTFSLKTDFSLGRLSSNVLASFANRCLRSLTVFLSSLLISFCHASQSLKYGSSFLKLLTVSFNSACLSLFIVTTRIYWILGS